MVKKNIKWDISLSLSPFAGCLASLLPSVTFSGPLVGLHADYARASRRLVDCVASLTLYFFAFWEGHPVLFLAVGFVFYVAFPFFVLPSILVWMAVLTGGIFFFQSLVLVTRRFDAAMRGVTKSFCERADIFKYLG